MYVCMYNGTGEAVPVLLSSIVSFYSDGEFVEMYLRI